MRRKNERFASHARQNVADSSKAKGLRVRRVGDCGMTNGSSHSAHIHVEYAEGMRCTQASRRARQAAGLAFAVAEVATEGHEGL